MWFIQAGPPDTSKIPIADAVGVTVVLLTCSYKSKEFIRVGYYVNNEYSDPELRETPPEMPVYEKVRHFLFTSCMFFTPILSEVWVTGSVLRSPGILSILLTELS